MATGSKGIVYGGGNRGQATILGPAPTTMDIIRLKQQKKAQQLADKKSKQKQFELASAIKPEKIRQTHGEYQVNSVNSFQKRASEISKNMDNMSEQEIRSANLELKQMKTDIDLDANQVNAYQKEEDKFRSEAKSNPHMNYDIVDASLKATNFNEDGTVKSPGELNVRDQNDVMNIPEAWNTNSIVTDFVGSFKTDKDSIGSVVGGYDIENSAESNFYEIENGRIKHDKDTGEPILKVTPETLNLATNDPDMARQIMFKQQAYKKETGEEMTPMDAFKSLIQPKVWKDEKKTKDANKFALQAERQKLKGKTVATEASIFYNNLDKILDSPIEDTQKELQYYIGADGAVNEKGQGNVLKPVVSQLDGMTIGNITDRQGKKKPITISETFHDYSTGDTYYKTSDSDELSLLNRENAGQLVEQIVGHDKNKKGYIEAGVNKGFLTTKEDGSPYYANKITPSESIKKEKEYQVAEAKAINEGLSTFKSSMIDLSKNIDKAEGGKLYGYTDEEVEGFNELFSELPKGVSISWNKEIYDDPKITIQGGGGVLFDSKDDFHIFIDGDDSGIIANEEGFKKVSAGLKATRQTGKLGAKRNSTSVETEKHGSSPKEGDEMEVAEGLAVFVDGEWKLKE